MLVEPESKEFRLVASAAATLQRAGYRTMLVGGSVRDMLIGRTPKDFDLVTVAAPEELAAVFPGRTQLVVISSSTEQLGEMFIREVYSLGGEGMLTRGELLERMEDSSAKKLGAWQVLEGKLLFVAKVPGDLDFEDLEAVIWAVAKSADAYEEEALETDEY